MSSKMKAYQRKRTMWGWIFCIPAAISLILFVVYPVCFSIILSFTDLRHYRGNFTFRGFRNYIYLFTNPSTLFWPSLLNSLWFAVATTVIQTVLGFLIAYLMYRMSKRLQGIFRVLVYVPTVLPSAVVAVMWKFIFAPNNGLVDKLLHAMGFQNLPAWLATPGLTMWVVIFVNTWWFVGTTIILYFMSMNALPKDCLEAARLDGASRWQEMRHIILPLTLSTSKVNIVMSFVGGMKSYSLFFLLTGGRGDTQVVGLIIFNMMYTSNNLSLSVTMSIVLSLILAVFVWFGNFYLTRKESDNDL